MPAKLTTGGLGLSQVLTRGLGPAPAFRFPETFWAALRGYLEIAPALAALTAVYLKAPKPGFAYPFAVVSPIDDDTQLNSTPDYWVDSIVQVSIFSDDDEQAEELGRAAYQVLSPWRDDGAGGRTYRPKIRAMDSYEMGAAMGFSRRATAGRGPRNKQVWAYHFQVTFTVGRSMVAPAG
jgi:hypothetical protein